MPQYSEMFSRIKNIFSLFVASYFFYAFLCHMGTRTKRAFDWPKGLSKRIIAKKCSMPYEVFYRRLCGIGTFTLSESKKISVAIHAHAKECAEINEYHFIRK